MPAIATACGSCACTTLGRYCRMTRDSFHAAREVDLVARREADEIDPLRRARVQLALRVRHEHGPVPALAEPQDGQERLLLSAAPGAGRVDVEAEHSSQSLASLRPT